MLRGAPSVRRDKARGSLLGCCSRMRFTLCCVDRGPATAREENIMLNLCAEVFKSRVVCPVIVLTNTHTNENERAGTEARRGVYLSPPGVCTRLVARNSC